MHQLGLVIAQYWCMIYWCVLSCAGNSTRFTAKSVAAAMEWVVAIKEAIRVEEEREREEVRIELC